MNVDEVDPGKGDPAGIGRLARVRREKHDDLGLGRHRLESCLRWASTEWRAEAGAAFCDAGELLVAELATLMDAVEQHGVVLEAYGREVGDIASVQRLLERRRVEVVAALRRTSDSLLVLEAEEAASPFLGADLRDLERRDLRRGEQAAHDELAWVGRRWAELIERRDAADSACIAGLYGAATSDFQAAATEVCESTTPQEALRRLDGLSVVELALLFGENPLLADLIGEASPEVVREWWDSLARLRPLRGDGLSAAQQALVLAVPWLIGNLDGVPPLVRIEANASTAAAQVVENQRVIDDVARHPLDDPRARELIAELERENAYLRDAAAVPPRVQLYTYDRAADRIVEMLGDWPVGGAPERVYTYVPGTYSTMNGFWAEQGRTQEVAAYLVERDGVPSVAFVYKDGVFPGGRPNSGFRGILEAADEDRAREAGEDLAAFQAGLRADPVFASSTPPRTIGIGHSWGLAAVTSSEVAGVHYDHVLSLAGAGVVDQWRHDPQTEYDSFRYHDVLGVAQATGLVYDTRTPQTLPGFGQHDFASEADERLHLTSGWADRLDAATEDHSLIARDVEGNQEALQRIVRELRTVDPVGTR